MNNFYKSWALNFGVLGASHKMPMNVLRRMRTANLHPHNPIHICKEDENGMG
jgi:hypothetical protein